jgi:protoporphyrinogen/coproporphyrinogen III oxidase
MPGKRAIVVGGGPAGVSAAFRLHQAGAAVTLIERDARIGGRTRSERIDGFIVDVAAGLMPGTYKAVYQLMEDAGLHDMLAPMTSPTAVVRDGRFHYLEMRHPLRAMLGTRLLSAGAKLDFAKVGLKAMSMWRSLDFTDITRAASYDTMSIADYARGAVRPELLEYLINPVEKIMYTLSAEEASVVDFFWCAKNLLSPDAYCVKGGMDRIVTEVSRHFEVCVGTEVVSVIEDGAAVRVRLRDAGGAEREERADVCVIATPAREVPKIDAGLSEASRSFLTGLRYSVLTDLHLRLRERPAEKAVLVMIPDSVDPELCGILVDHNKGDDRAPPGKGALSVYFLDRWAQQAYHWPDEQVYAAGLAKVERVMPGIGALVEGYLVQRWDYAATASYPGYYRDLKRFAGGLDLDRRVQLAGDYFSMASVNSAVTSGQISARRLAERYL